ncbi:MAG TPA: hypothetical protein VNG71_22175 [Pyrinomonadaceae bacterium]|nr:hypothetical protein [Pyrinomonadaceae bacterium]
MPGQLDERTSRGEQAGSLFNVPYQTEVIVRMAGDRSTRRGDYPCGCRRCQELKVESTGKANSLACIDVYDLPDAVEIEPADYFH